MKYPVPYHLLQGLIIAAGVSHIAIYGIGCWAIGRYPAGLFTLGLKYASVLFIVQTYCYLSGN